MGMIGNSLAQGLISGANIQDGTVDTPDLKDSAVSTAKVADGAVTNAKINDVAASKVTGTVGTSQIADAAVTAAKLGSTAVTDKLGYTPANAANLTNVENKSSATIRGELTSGNVTGALGYTPVNKAGDTMTGNLVIQKEISGSSGDAPISVYATNSQSNLYMRAAKLFDSSLKTTPTPQHIVAQIGQSDTSFNTAQFGFGYAGSGSQSNYATIGLHSRDEIIKCYGNGAVAMQYQPAFRAVSSTNTFTPSSGQFTTTYDVAVFNRGNHFNTTTGRFTAPVAGVYFFYHQMSARTATSSIYEVKLYDQTGNELARLFSTGAGYGHGAMVSVTHNMAAGDYVQAGCYNGAGVVFSGSADAYANFTSVSGWGGYLIG